MKQRLSRPKTKTNIRGLPIAEVKKKAYASVQLIWPFLGDKISLENKTKNQLVKPYFYDQTYLRSTSLELSDPSKIGMSRGF